LLVKDFQYYFHVKKMKAGNGKRKTENGRRKTEDGRLGEKEKQEVIRLRPATDGLRRD
jgi:hypothetical protein